MKLILLAALFLGVVNSMPVSDEMYLPTEAMGASGLFACFKSKPGEILCRLASNDFIEKEELLEYPKSSGEGKLFAKREGHDDLHAAIEKKWIRRYANGNHGESFKVC